MKIAIFGATGGTGRLLTHKALKKGHEVTSVARNPSAIPQKHEFLRVVKGDVMDPESLAPAVEGQEAIITSIAVRGKDEREPTTLFSEGHRNIINAMKKQEVGRLVCLSAGAVEPDPALGIVFGRIIRPLLFKNMYSDMSRMEHEVRISGLDWVILRPSMLTDKPGTGRYVLGIDRIPRGWRIPHEDVADFTLDQLDDDRYLWRHIAMTS